MREDSSGQSVGFAGGNGYMLDNHQLDDHQRKLQESGNSVNKKPASRQAVDIFARWLDDLVWQDLLNRINGDKLNKALDS